jgi:hypothetical protein
MKRPRSLAACGASSCRGQGGKHPHGARMSVSDGFAAGHAGGSAAKAGSV